MYRPTYELGSFLPLSAEDRIRILRALLEALASTNAVYLANAVYLGPRG